MQITNLQMETLSGVTLEAPVPANQRQRSGNDFDNILQDANRRQAANEPSVSRERVERQRTERREGTSYHEAVAVDENLQLEALPETNEYVIEESVHITDEAAPEYVKALQYVAEAAVIPAEALKEWLVKESAYLHELHENENLPKFVEYTLGKKEPAELLTDPVLPEIHKALQEAAELLKQPQEAPAQKEVVIKEAAKNTAPLIQADIEGLEVLEEDGEVVVTKELDEMANQGESNNSSGNSGSSSANTASQAATGSVIAAPQGEAVAIELQPVVPMQETNTAWALQTAEAARPTLIQTPINAQDVINQIMTQVKVATSGQNFTEMRITLRPESLGEIMLRVITQNGIVMAQFEAESQRIKETLESNFNQLRDALTEAGVAFGELNVFVRQEGQERLNQFERERLAARRRMESILAEEEVDETKDPLHNGILDEVA